MSDRILSVGIDLGTTTTQMIVSRLSIANTAAPFAVPRMEIQEREIVYRSAIYFTPLLDARTLDAPAIEAILRQEYAKAGIRPEEVQTGAVIITGETARKENAREVLKALSDLAGDFVVATAGPGFESVLAARGAGADRAAKERGRYVLHMDIGGGTSNLALFDPEGKLIDTGCLNVGGRLMKFDASGRVTYVSPVLDGMEREQVIPTLVQVLEEAAGFLPQTALLERFITDQTVKLPEEPVLLSFSGGVADLIREPHGDYGDLGAALGQAIGQSRLCQGEYLLGQETIRATVIGAGSYATELSGSTVSYGNVDFPLQNLPVVSLDDRQLHEGEVTALTLEGYASPTYGQVSALADRIARQVPDRPLVIAMEQDMGKALGQALQVRLGKDVPLVCLDGIHAPVGSYLDIAAPVAGGTAVPVVVKTLAFM